MIVQPVERNIYDQKGIEFALWDKHKIKMVRHTLGDIHDFGSLDKDGQLIVAGNIIAISYYRAGYTPNDYPTEKEWKARLLIEQSLSIKCPNVAYHLLGTKKIQQIFCNTQILERFVKDSKKIGLLKQCFACLFSMDEFDMNKRAVEDAKKNPDNYVLKPQREGGGNNIYGQQVKETIEKLSSKELSAFILMERVRPPISNNFILREGKIYTDEPMISELGIYSVFLSDANGKILLDEEAGHLLRTKLATTNEGGVAAGASALDSPWLI